MTQHGDQIHRHAYERAKGWRYRLSRWLGLLGLSAISALPALAQTPAVPQHWTAYAQLAGNQFQAWLSDPANDTVVRLHAALQERLANPGQTAPPPSVVARVWVGASGRVERLEFASLGNTEADADLRAALTAQPLPEPPPHDMRQPMVLELTLNPAAPI